MNDSYILHQSIGTSTKLEAPRGTLCICMSCRCWILQIQAWSLLFPFKISACKSMSCLGSAIIFWIQRNLGLWSSLNFFLEKLLRSITKSLQTSASNSESRARPWLRNFMSFWSWKTRFGSPTFYRLFWNSQAVTIMSPFLRQTLYKDI